MSKECQDLSLEVAAKGLEALQARDDPDKLKRLDEELAALRAKLEKECPQVASSTGG